MLPAGLRCFVAVAQSGSMREASQRMRLAQSAISRRIQLLEEELGTQLLERGARGVALTPAGEILLQHARDAMLQEEQLRAELDALRGLRRGNVVVRSVPGFSAGAMRTAVAAFHAAHPAVTLDIGVAQSSAILSALRERSCHLGIVFSTTEEEEADMLPLASAPEPLAAVMSTRHKLAGARSLTLAETLDHPLVVPLRQTAARRCFDAACAAAGLVARPLLQTNSPHLAAHFVAGGNAIAVMIPHVMSPYFESGSMQAIRLSDPPLNAGRVTLLRRQGRRLPAAAEALAIALANGLSLPAGDRLE